MLDFKEKPEEQGYAFLIDMMKVWSDENLEDFFRKEGISINKKPPLVAKKLPAEPTKNGLPSLKSIFTKKKVASKLTYRDLVFSAAGLRNTFFENGISDA